MTSRRLRLGRRLSFALWAGYAIGCSSPTAPVVETPPAPVTVSQPVERLVTDFDDYEGRIAAVDSVEVRARVRGHVIKVNFQDGQIVKKGELLYEIDPRDYKASFDAANAQKAAADAALELAKKEYERSAALFKTRAASREEMDIAAARQAVADAERLKAIALIERAKLDLDFTKVVAPLDGKTSRSQVSVGNLINSSGGETLLTTVVSVDPIYVYFDVDERSLLRYRQVFRKGEGPGGAVPPIKDLKVPVYVGLEGETGYPHQGIVDFADNRVNPSTGTIVVRGVLANAKRDLESGMRARVRVPVGEPHKSLLITERAVGADQGRRFVYVVNEQNIVDRRDVKLDRISDGLQVVKEGVKPDDWVIVNGIQRVREAAKVDPTKVPMPGASSDKGASSDNTTQPKKS